MRTGKDRVRAIDTQGQVSLGSASVAPGDLVVGDSDGVVIIPRERESIVLEYAAEIAAAEAEIRRLIDNGTTVRDARMRLGYHGLQRREQEG